MLCIFNFPCYEDTCLNKEVICIILENALHGNGLCKDALVKKKMFHGKMGVEP